MMVAFAQPPSKFYATYGGSEDDFGYSCKQGLDGSYLICGSSSSGGNGQTDMYFLKLDIMGQKVFEKYIGGAGNEVGKDMVLLNDSGYILGGYTSSFGNGGYDMYLVRIDKYGTILWQRTFGGTDWDFASGITLNADSNIVLVGNSYSSTLGKSDGMFVLCDRDGNTIVQHYVGGSEDDELNTCLLSSDGKVSIAGNTRSYGDLNSNFWLLKVDGQGNVTGTYTLGTNNKAEHCYDFLENSENELMFCGSRDSSANNSGKNVAYLLKSDLNGNFIDDFIQAGAFTDDDKYNAIALTANGKKYLLSRKVYNGFFNMDVQPILMDTNYTINSATTYGGEKDEEALDVIVTNDNGFLMLGYTYSYGTVTSDIFLIKLDSTIYLSQSVVGNQEVQIVRPKKMYYSEGKVHYENKLKELFLYRILNINGQVVQAAVSDQNQIDLKDGLVPGIYTIEIVGWEKTVLKFYKE